MTPTGLDFVSPAEGFAKASFPPNKMRDRDIFSVVLVQSIERSSKKHADVIDTARE